MAVEVRYVGTRLVDGPATEDWNEVNWTSNGFLDEFKLAQAEPAGQHRGRCGRGNVVRLLRSGHGHLAAADLPGGLQRPAPVRAGNAALYTGANWTNTPRLAELARAQSEPRRRGNTLFTQRGVPRQHGHRRLPAQLLRPQPGTSATPPSGPTASRTTYDSLQFDAAARAVGRARRGRQLRVRERYASRLEHPARAASLVRSTDGVPHALKMTVIYELPFGRGQRFGTDMNTWLNARRRRLVAEPDGPRAEREHPELRQRARRRHDDRRAAGRVQDPHRSDATGIVYTLPQDIIDNTIKAFSTSATSATRLRRAGTADRPLPGAGQRSRLHSGSPRRLRAARRVRRRSDLHALRPEREEALHVSVPDELRARRWTC